VADDGRAEQNDGAMGWRRSLGLLVTERRRVAMVRYAALSHPTPARGTWPSSSLPRCASASGRDK
jgi:hypothetical protein